MALELLNPEGQRGEAEHLHGYDIELFVWCFALDLLALRKGYYSASEIAPFQWIGDFR